MTFSLATLVRAQARLRPDAIALVSDEVTVTFGQLDRRSNQWSDLLSGDGVQRQDRIAFLGRNCIEFFDVLCGAGKLNAVVVALNWRLTAHELVEIVTDAAAVVVCCTREFAAVLDGRRDDLPTVRTILVVDDAETGNAPDASAANDPGAVPQDEDVAVQFYTSGTTGVPKGVMITNAALGSAVLGLSARWGFDDSAVNLVAMPLFHIGGSGWALNGLVVGGATVILRDATDLAISTAMERHSVTHTFLVPAVLRTVVEHVASHQLRLPQLRTVVYGASPIAERDLRRAVSVLGCSFIQAYGLTETTGAVTELGPDDHRFDGSTAHRLRSCGRALPWVALRITDPETGLDCRRGTIGEIWVRAEQLMAGYWNRPDETRAVIESGWLRTGDAAYMDEDEYVYIVDRVKDMIVTGGENVYPAEIERALLRHPAVEDAAVVGVPDERWGEAVKAVVVLAEGSHVSEHALTTELRASLAGYKVPKSVDFVSELPRNASGKVLRRQLREGYWTAADRRVG